MITGDTGENLIEIKQPDLIQSFEYIKVVQVVLKTIKESLIPPPFECKINPHVDEMQKVTEQWIQEFKLTTDKESFKEISSKKYAHFMAKTYPTCDPARAQFMSDFVTWFFINDDGNEASKLANLKKINDKTLRVLSSGNENLDTPFVIALNNLVKRLDQFVQEKLANSIGEAKHEGNKRFIKYFDKHLRATEWESKNREEHKNPDLVTFLKKRPHTGGAYVMFSLIEIAEKTNIPNRIFKKYLKELSLAANNVIVFSNDIFSLPRELKDEKIKGNTINNLAFIFMEQFGFSLDAALKKTAEFHNIELEKFSDLKKALFNDSEAKNEIGEHFEDVKKFIAGLESWMIGHYSYAMDAIEKKAQGRYEL